MAFAVFSGGQKLSSDFATKAEAFSFAEDQGYVIVGPARDEDPPRRILNLRYSIEPVAEHNVYEFRPRPIQPELGEAQLAAS